MERLIPAIFVTLGTIGLGLYFAAQMLISAF